VNLVDIQVNLKALRVPDLNEVKGVVIIWIWVFFDNSDSCLSELQMSFLLILLLFV